METSVLRSVVKLGNGGSYSHFSPALYEVKDVFSSSVRYLFQQLTLTAGWETLIFPVIMNMKHAVMVPRTRTSRSRNP